MRQRFRNANAFTDYDSRKSDRDRKKNIEMRKKFNCIKEKKKHTKKQQFNFPWFQQKSFVCYLFVGFFDIVRRAESSDQRPEPKVKSPESRF